MRNFIIATILLCLPSSMFAFWTAYFEAENFTNQTGGNKASSEYFPYIGEGYLEMGGQGAAVAWNNITVPQSGKYTLILKYANNTQQILPCDLKVNGEHIKNIPFGPFKKNWEMPWPDATGYNSETVGWAKYWNARVIVDLKAGANMLELIVSSTTGGPHIDNIGVSTAVSEPPAPVVNVKDYGAVADGTTDNTEAIAKAIAACPDGGSVVFDEGIYMSGSITLKANMTLWVSENAVIRAIQDNDKIQTYLEGPFAKSSHYAKYFMYGNQVDNLTITGGGSLDGNAVDGYRAKPDNNRAFLLGFVNSKNVTVTNVDLLNSDFWTFVPQESDHVIIDGINIYTPRKDGIDPLDCHNIYITNNVVSSGDDAMTPKSYSSKGFDNLVVKNLTVNFCKWKGIKLGFSSVGDFNNCLFEDIAMVHVQAGITVLLIDGCSASNLTFNRINMNNVFTPITLLNGGGLRSKGQGISAMKNVFISNLDVRNVWDPQGSFITGTKVGDTIYKVENVYLTNVNVDSFKGGLTTVPDTPIEYDGRKADISLFGELPAWGYYIRHADNVVFKNVTHSVSPEDAREGIVLEDVTKFINE
jgi:polygalacturonase